MTALEASVISMHFAATPVKNDQGEGISAGFRLAQMRRVADLAGLLGVMLVQGIESAPGIFS